MINEKTTALRNRLLAELRDADAPRSGDQLGGCLGVSRVTILNHIRALAADGYPIHTDRHGYTLNAEGTDALSAWEFSPEEGVLVLREATSTMAEARHLIEDGRQPPFTVVARRQLAGRNRWGGEWDSPEGGLWATHVCRPEGSALRTVRHGLTAAYAMARVLKALHGLDAKVRWPGDVVVEGHKVAGVLTEARSSGDRYDYLALGLGVYVNHHHGVMTDETFGAVGVMIGGEVDRRDLLRSWLREFEELRRKDSFIHTPSWWPSWSTPSLPPKHIDPLGRLVHPGSNATTEPLAPGDIKEKS